MKQRAAVEDGRQQSGSDIPETCAGPEYLSECKRIAARVRTERDIRKAICCCYPDLCTCGVKIGLCLQDVGPLLYERRRQAEWQVGRKRQACERELLSGCLGRVTAGEDGEQIILLVALLEQRRQCRFEL